MYVQNDTGRQHGLSRSWNAVIPNWKPPRIRSGLLSISGATMKLFDLPRRAYTEFATPLEPLPRLSRALGGAEIWIKRDDQLGLAGGGNKTRKLEYVMAAALNEGAKAVMTVGAVQSNH